MKKPLFLLALMAIGCATVSAQQTSRRSDRKIIELKKIITLSPTQETALRAAYEQNATESDSILYKIPDPVQAAQAKYNSDKKLKQTLMKTLTESQRNTYIRVTSTPEVQAKAAAKAANLSETGNYTQAQLDSAQTQIFEYLMLEKVVYSRDKYDYRKQKENIRMLKKFEPVHLRKANVQEKLRTGSKTEQGRVQW
jgi:hypothetical protein